MRKPRPCRPNQLDLFVGSSFSWPGSSGKPDTFDRDIYHNVTLVRITVDLLYCDIMAATSSSVERLPCEEAKTCKIFPRVVEVRAYVESTSGDQDMHPCMLVYFIRVCIYVQWCTSLVSHPYVC